MVEQQGMPDHRPLPDGYATGRAGYLTVDNTHWQIERWGVRLKNPDIPGEITLTKELPYNSQTTLRCACCLIDLFGRMITGRIEILDQPNEDHPIYRIQALGNWSQFDLTIPEPEPEIEQHHPTDRALALD